MPRNHTSYLRHRSTRSQYRSRINLAAVIATSSLLCASSFVLGQGAKVMVLNDENESPIIAHFSMPDLASLREPDFMKRDLPRFKERLMLSDAQVAAFEAQIDAYLEAFEKLMLDLLNVPGAKPLVIKQMIDDGEGGQKRVILGPENLDDLPAIKLEDLKLEDGMPAELGLDVNVRVGGPEGEEDQGDGPRVSVAFRAADGEEIPEEVRQKLEQQAAEMAEKIRKQIEEQQGAEGPNGAVAVPGLPGMNPESLEKMQQDQERFAAAAAEFRKAKSDLRQNFVAEAHTKLSEPQVERWQGLERALLRDRSLPKGRLSGERTDLFKAVEQIEIPAHSGSVVQTELEAYEVALDHALRQRDDYLQDMDSKLDKAMQERNFDRALTMIDRGAALRVAIRTINEQFTENIAASLTDEQAAAFRSAVLRMSYPNVYRQTFGEKVFAATNKIEGLDDQVRASIAELEKAYRSELDQANVALRRAIDKHEPLQPRRPIEHMKAISAGAEPTSILRVIEDDPIREAFAKRRTLDERYAKSVANLLTPDQAAQLPTAPVRRAAGEPLIIRRVGGE